MLISVIIPCYNAEKWIFDCVTSVIQQSYKNLEIIFIDDGSTDRSAEIIKNIKDERIKYHYKKNGGLSSARNYGIKIASGEWISFLDSDDIWNKDKIEKQLSFSEMADAVYCDYEFIDATNNTILGNNIHHPKTFHYNYKHAILSGNIIAGGSSLMIKKSVIDKIGLFDTQLKLGEDWEYWARIIWANYKFKYIDKKLIKIRVHENSMQKTTNAETWHQSYHKILYSFLAFDEIQTYEKAIIYKKLVIVDYRFHRRWDVFKKHYLLCIKHHNLKLFNMQLLGLLIKFPIREIYESIKND